MRKKFALFLILFNGIILLCPGIARSEEKPDSAAPVETRLTLAYLCHSGDSITLTANLGIKRGDFPLSLANAGIEFSILANATSIPMGMGKTDQEGIAKITISSAILPAVKDGMITYQALFKGTSKYPEAGASITAKPARLQLSFSIQDSSRVLKVTATQKDDKGFDTPLPKETVLVYVPRLFSLLKIGEISLDENGIGTLEFPKEIVGDTLGNLTVLAQIEENDKFGFVQGKEIINWGIHKQYYKAEVPSRELWTPVAPLWMIITLIIMLAGVWAHYIYAVYELVMIKRLSKKDKSPY